MTAAARALGKLHAAGLCHGDVHAGNFLVERGDTVRLCDLGWAVRVGEDHPQGRAGVDVHCDPELAVARLQQSSCSPTTQGEQYSLATVFYRLATGSNTHQFRMAREELMAQIAREPVASFRDAGVEPWPDLEAVLARALAKDADDRFGSVNELATALEELQELETVEARGSIVRPFGQSGWAEESSRAIDAFGRASPVGDWFVDGLGSPTGSLQLGAAGLSLGLLHGACAMGNGTLLAWARLWAERALETLDDSAFLRPEIGVDRADVGPSPLFHGPEGVWWTSFLVARSWGDDELERSSVERFLECAQTPLDRFDATLGYAGRLIVCCNLLEISKLERERLSAIASHCITSLRELFAAEPTLEKAGEAHLGFAHGWAGMTYALLRWLRVARATSDDSIVADLESVVGDRLEQLGRLAVAWGRGLAWPWFSRPASLEPRWMPGWCNGSAGFVLLWQLADEVLGPSAGFRELGEGAAWSTWDSEDRNPTLCCGGVGRAFAVLRWARHTGEPVWVDRAAQLAQLAQDVDWNDHDWEDDYPHSLMRGEIGVAVLTAALELGADAGFPVLESPAALSWSQS